MTLKIFKIALKKPFLIFMKVSPFRIMYFSNTGLGSKTDHESIGFIS
jgi:hypothetical protein